VPDVTKPLGTTYGGGGDFWEQTLRVSWQASEKDKIGVYYNNKKREYTNGAQNLGLESRATTYFFPFSDQLVQWSRPHTNHLLFEAAFWRHQETWGNRRADSDIVDPLAIGVTDNNPLTQVPGYLQLINSYHGRVGSTDTPQSELPQQLQHVVRDRLPRRQDRHRPERRLAVVQQRVGHSVQLRREHAGE
jgi:hypothetical protein